MADKKIHDEQLYSDMVDATDLDNKSAFVVLVLNGIVANGKLDNMVEKNILSNLVSQVFSGNIQDNVVEITKSISSEKLLDYIENLKSKELLLLANNVKDMYLAQKEDQFIEFVSAEDAEEEKLNQYLKLVQSAQ